MYSANIEGNSIDLNSFMNYKLSQAHFSSTKEIEEIEHLIAAYEFAQTHSLQENHVLECHAMLSQALLIESKRGNYREENVGVFDQKGLVYLALEPEYIEETMAAFFQQLSLLIRNRHSPSHVFYFASLLHLRFAHIHPFMDGNGRVARLLEKWFLAETLGKTFWKIPSEKYYKEHQRQYYQNLNLGVNYYELDYGRSLPFLVMLPQCLKKNNGMNLLS